MNQLFAGFVMVALGTFALLSAGEYRAPKNVTFH